MEHKASYSPSSTSTTTTTPSHNLTYLQRETDILSIGEDSTNREETPDAIIQRAAVDYLGRKLPPALLKQALFYARRMDAWVVGEAIRAASEAPMPSWRYVVAVLARCDREGVKCYDDWCERDLRFRSGRY